MVLCWCQHINSAVLGQECLGHSSGSVLHFGETHRHSPNHGQHCGCTGPYNSYYAPQQQPSGNCGKQNPQDLSLTGPRGYVAHLRATQQGCKQRGRERVWTWGSALTGVKGEVPRVQQVHSSLAKLKRMSRNESVGRERQGLSSGQLSRSPRAFYRGTSWVGGHSLSLHLVVQLAVCVLGMDVFEVDAWEVKSFMSGTYTIIIKSLLSGTYTTSIQYSIVQYSIVQYSIVQ